MPLTPDMRRSIEQIRDYLYGGGYPDPVTNAEQLSFLFFFYLVEGIDDENILKAKVLKTTLRKHVCGRVEAQKPAERPSPRSWHHPAQPLSLVGMGKGAFG